MLIILTNFLSLIDCQRCQISLCDRERPSVFKRVFDLQRQDMGKELEAPFENRLPLKSEITENVAKTGQKINLCKPQLLQNEVSSENAGALETLRKVCRYPPKFES